MSRITITNERIQKNKMRRDILEVRGVVKGVANVGYKGGHCGKGCFQGVSRKPRRFVIVCGKSFTERTRSAF